MPLVILRPGYLDVAGSIVSATLAKGNSASYLDRTALDAAALATIGPTGGLGVGWGGFRASSLLPGLLANGGIPALAAVIWLALGLASLARRAVALAPRHPGRVVVDAFGAAVCGQVMAALLSSVVPTFTRFHSPLHGTLPPPPRLVLGASHIVATVWSLPDAPAAAELARRFPPGTRCPGTSSTRPVVLATGAGYADARQWDQHGCSEGGPDGHGHQHPAECPTPPTCVRRRVTLRSLFVSHNAAHLYPEPKQIATIEPGDRWTSVHTGGEKIQFNVDVCPVGPATNSPATL